MEQIFDAMHDLYVKSKAQSFLLIDVPPMHRSPGGKEVDLDDERYMTWNSELLLQANTFAKEASKASIYVISSYSIMSDILEDPARYGLLDTVGGEDKTDDGEDEEEDILDSEGPKPMWEDDIHLSSVGHRVLADRLWEILRG